MEASFRASMNWLHTWAGVVLGGLLLAIFWTGSLSVFDREIDRWMMPMTRLGVPDKPVALESVRPAVEAAALVRSPVLFVTMPTERQPVMQVSWRNGATTILQLFDPASGVGLPDPGTLAGTGFLYPLHYMLHIRFADLGVWLVGFAGMAMLALCVSGVIIHRKIFIDFFTFRPQTKSRRLLLDLHNVAGVLGLPFHFLITLSGLILFYSIYFPGSWQGPYQGDRQAFSREVFGLFERPRSNKPGDTASLDAMADAARQLWDGDALSSLVVRYPGDAAAYVQIGRTNDRRINAVIDIAYFDAATGALLRQRSGDEPMAKTQQVIAGLHLIRFRHWTLRWLYFGLGLSGCVLIGTGFLFWLESRRRRHAQLGLAGVRIVEGLAIGSVTGIVAATLAFFVANRLLPLGIGFLGQERAALEIWGFGLVWLAAYGHAWLRPHRAWVEQCWAIAGLALAAVALNWITTGHHLLRSVSHRELWGVGGMDLLMLCGAAASAIAAVRLDRSATAARP